MKFREHRGTLEESMRTLVVIEPTREAIAHHLCGVFSILDPRGIEVRPYYFDDRIGWDTHIVLWQGMGVLGYTDGPLK